jgi:hypothetical protein
LRRWGLLAVALLVTLGAAAASQAEVVQEGDVIVAFDGGISPRALPRAELAPVTVTIDSSFRSAAGNEPPPQLKTISIGINRRGRIFDRGLPTCRVRRIQPTTIDAAKKICGGAIVGSGHVQVLVNLANQPPFLFTGPMLVFNAERSGGERRLLAQVYGRKPPSAFVLNFRVVKEPGEFGTVIKTSLPQSAIDWAYVTQFDMKLRRIYDYGGERRSFVNAACAAPEGFPGAVFAFARANFGFAGGEKVTATVVKDCVVRK